VYLAELSENAEKSEAFAPEKKVGVKMNECSSL